MRFEDLKKLALQMNNLKFKGMCGIVRDFEEINWLNDSVDIQITDMYYDKTNLEFVVNTDINDKCLESLKNLELNCTGICTKCNYFAFCLDKYNKIKQWVVKANATMSNEEVRYDSTRTY